MPPTGERTGARRRPDTSHSGAIRPLEGPASPSPPQSRYLCGPPPHSPWRGRGVRSAGIEVCPAAGAAAAVRAPPRVRASTLTAPSARRRRRRRPPQPSLNGRRARPASPGPAPASHAPPHCGSADPSAPLPALPGPRISLPAPQGPRFAAGHARARRGTTFRRPAPSTPLSSRRRGTLGGA